jgi:4-hydroxybenzoate polyprenyltransferase
LTQIVLPERKRLRDRIGAWVQLIRVRQWSKNLILLAPVLFARRLFWPPDAFPRALAGMGLFCLLSSAVYILNDILDLQKDRRHPSKRSRPLAAGRISVRAAAVAGCVLAAGALGGSLLLRIEFGLVAAMYAGLNVLYCLRLKRMVILDVFAVAAGFVLRAWAGAMAVAVGVSSWFLAAVMLLSLFLALGKRRHELILLENRAAEHRGNLSEYSAHLLDQMMAVVTASTVMTYSLYTLLGKFRATQLKLTIPLVLYGIFRYQYLVYRRNRGGAPEKVLTSDPPLLINAALFAVTACLALYWRHFALWLGAG